MCGEIDVTLISCLRIALAYIEGPDLVPSSTIESRDIFATKIDDTITNKRSINSVLCLVRPQRCPGYQVSGEKGTSIEQVQFPLGDGNPSIFVALYGRPLQNPTVLNVENGIVGLLVQDVDFTFGHREERVNSYSPPLLLASLAVKRVQIAVSDVEEDQPLSG